MLRFHSEFRAGFWSGAAVADLQVNVKVTDPTGRIVFTRTFTAEGVNPGIQLASGENARVALEAGLQRLIRQIGDDGDLTRALVTLAPPQALPTPSAGRRPMS